MLTGGQRSGEEHREGPCDVVVCVVVVVVFDALDVVAAIVAPFANK